MRTPVLDAATQTVVSVCNIDPDSSWQPPSGQAVGAPSNTANIGDTWDGSQYVRPVETAPQPTASDVNEERDARMYSSFSWGGKQFDCSERSIAKITGAVLNATMAVLNGAAAGDLRWHGGATDFSWTANDDSEVPMDAPTMQAFGAAAAAHVDTIHRKARALKEMTPIPADYKSDSHWT